jgi:hypothetical protein
MKRFRNVLFASFGLIFILTLALTLTGRWRAVAQTRDCIKICDDAPLSTVVKNILSVIGEVKISNDSDSPIPARVSGPIQIASSSVNAVRTKPVLQVTDTFQREVKITLEPNDPISTTTFNVPQSRLLVIEGWGGFAQMGHPVQYPVVHFKTLANGSMVNYPVFSQAGGGGWFLSDPGWGGKAYADPDSTVEVTFARSNPIGTATMSLVLTGHYVDQ